MSLVKLTIKRDILQSNTKTELYAFLILNCWIKEPQPLIVIELLKLNLLLLSFRKRNQATRPLTHDSFKNFAERSDIVVKQVIIYKLLDGVFYL